MDGLLTAIFAALWSIFGSDPAVPIQAQNVWASSAWEQQAGDFVFKSVSTSIPDQCRETPNSFVDFPMVINGAHVITADGRPLMTFSDPKFKDVRSVYGKPTISCSDVVQAKSLEWTVITDSKYFARFITFPQVEHTRPLDNFFYESLNIVAAGTLLVMGLFCMIIFSGKVPNRIPIYYFLSNIFLSLYFVGTVTGLMSMKVDMLTVHRVGDSALWIGCAFLYFVLAEMGLIGKKLAKFYASVVAVGLVLQWTARTGDEVQMGTNFSFIPTFIVVFYAMYALTRKLIAKRAWDRMSVFQMVGMTIFVVTSINDMLVVMGAFDGYLYYSVGLIAQMLLMALSVHETIAETYTERDYLRSNLEKEVERKTKELKHTQAELVQSAKLASLGTLSAGIAHEINNSINFVNGAIQPLERLIGKLEPVSPKDHEVGKKLLLAIKDGVGITVEIVKSLRQFTGLNQAKLKDVRIQEVARSVTTILHAKLKDSYRVELDIPEELTLYGDVVGINQILMNLMTNAIDAMPKGGTIRISAKEDADSVVVEVRDSGAGIPREILDKIFDPFFTTKEVGKGTGLGLYIVNKEMERYQGKVVVNSIPAHGTAFELIFPKNIKSEMAAAA